MMDWENFVTKHERHIYAFCLHYLGNVADAEDVTQDVFMRYFKDFQAGKELHQGWLYTVARNACADKKRWFRRFSGFLQGMPKESPKITTPLLDNLLELLQTLSRHQREVFILRHFHGFSTIETANLLGISEGTTKTHLSRAIEKIRKGLADEN